MALDSPWVYGPTAVVFTVGVGAPWVYGPTAVVPPVADDTPWVYGPILSSTASAVDAGALCIVDGAGGAGAFGALYIVEGAGGAGAFGALCIVDGAGGLGAPCWYGPTVFFLRYCPRLLWSKLNPIRAAPLFVFYVALSPCIADGCDERDRVG